MAYQACYILVWLANYSLCSKSSFDLCPVAKTLVSLTDYDNIKSSYSLADQSLNDDLTVKADLQTS